MAGSCSADLRSRVLAAMEAGESPTAAKRFSLGRSSACRRAQAARGEGRRGAKRMGGGPAPRIAGAVEAARPDLPGGEDNPLTLAQRRGLAQIASRFRWLGRADGRSWPPLDGGPDAVPVMDPRKPPRGFADLRPRDAPRIRALLDRSGCACRCLPAHSPDLTPIEPAWAKVKAELRRVAARTTTALHQAVGPALATVTAQDAAGFLHHCGYGHSRPS